MKDVLELVASKQQSFAQLPLFKFLRDSNVDPRQRLAFAPYFAPFVMGFGELNRTVFRDETSSDPIQLMINQHSREDDSHWIWFLEDLQKLRFDLFMTFSDSLRFLWGDETQAARHMVYELYRHTYQAPPLQKLVVIEAIEATAEIFLTATLHAARDLQTLTGADYRYFGNLHHAIDTGHSLHLTETQQLIAGLTLSDQTRSEAFEYVENVFQLFTDFFGVILSCAKTTSIAAFDQAHAPVAAFSRTVKPTVPPTLHTVPIHQGDRTSHAGKRLGTYLVEAGLLTTERLEVALSEQEKTAKRLGEVLSSQGWVNQQTIEYLMEKVVLPERRLSQDRSLSLAS